MSASHYLFTQHRLAFFGRVHPFSVIEDSIMAYSTFARWMLPVLSTVPAAPLDVSTHFVLPDYLI
jgi:hypothetical protein